MLGIYPVISAHFRCRLYRRIIAAGLCIPHNSAEHEPYAWESHTVAPHLVFRTVGIRVFQPLGDLLVGFHLAAGHFGVGLEYLVPEVHFFIGRFFRAEIGTPVVREALKPGTLGGCQTPDGVSALDSTRSFGYQCRLKLLFKGRSEFGVLPLVEGVSTDAVANGGGVFVVTGKDGRSLIFGNLGKAADCHGIDSVAVDRIEGKADILVDAVTLWTVLIVSTDHGALQHEGLLLRSGIGTHHGGVVSEVTNLITLILRESNPSCHPGCRRGCRRSRQVSVRFPLRRCRCGDYPTSWHWSPWRRCRRAEGRR